MSKRILALTITLMTLVVLCGAPAVAFAYDGSVIKKEETVYVITDSHGNQDDVIVSDQLCNEQKLKTISDETTLSDIENVKGDEKFKQKGNKLEWAANGKDIFYQGKTDKEVPVSVNVTYTLDGQSITGPELQGKSGDVVINVKFINNGTYEGKTIPFIVLTGLIVTDESFTDIKIDHGRILDDGDKQIVAGIAAPGLAQTLDIAEAELGFGDSIRISGKANKFAVEDMMTIVTNSIFEDVDADQFGDLDYDDQINQLDKGAKQLVEGSSDLYDGLNQLNEKAPKLKEGTNKLDQGSKKLVAGIKQALSGVISKLDDMSEVNTKVKTGIEGIDINNQSLGTISSNLSGSVNANCDSAMVQAILSNVSGLSDDQKAVLEKALTTQLTVNATAGGVSLVNNNIDALINGGTVLDPSGKTVQTLESGIKDGEDGEAQYIAGIKQNLKEQKDNPGNPETLVGGASQLAEGMSQLNSQTDSLVDGAEQLSDGSKQLSKGMKKLYNEGIKKIVDLYNDELKSTVNGLESMMDAGKGYKTFTKLPSNMDGNVKFIYKTTISK